MPVYDAAYRTWPGKARRHKAAWWVVAATMNRKTLQKKIVRFFLIGLPILGCGLGGLVLYLGYNQFVGNLLRKGGVESDFLVIIYRFFFQAALLPTMVIAALSACPLIAEDRRSKALPLYFVRPITHLDYLIGKLLSSQIFLWLVLLTTPLVIFLIQGMLIPPTLSLWDFLPALGRALTMGALLSLLLGSMGLGISSISRRTAYAVGLFFALLFVLPGVAEALYYETRVEVWMFLSPISCLFHVMSDMFQVPAFVNDDIHVRGLGQGTAWLCVGAWIGLGLGVTALKVRRVEVVQ